MPLLGLKDDHPTSTRDTQKGSVGAIAISPNTFGWCVKKLNIFGLGIAKMRIYNSIFFDQFSANRVFGFAETLSFFLEF